MRERNLKEFAIPSVSGHRAVGIETVSTRSLPKTGILQCLAGDFRCFRPTKIEIGNTETNPRLQKDRYWRAFLVLVSPVLARVDWLAGDGVGFEPVSSRIPC